MRDDESIHSARVLSRATIWAALIASAGVVVAAWIGVGVGRSQGEDRLVALQEEFEGQKATLEELRREREAEHTRVATPPMSAEVSSVGAPVPSVAQDRSDGASQDASLASQAGVVSPQSDGEVSGEKRRPNERGFPAFETESYRLVVDSVRKGGNAVVLGLFIEATGSTAIGFLASRAYLRDETGEEWRPQQPDTAGLFPERWIGVRRAPGGSNTMGVEILPRTRRRTEATFYSLGGASSGTSFTLVAEELAPVKGRQIVIREIDGG